MSIYSELGVKKVVNASFLLTRLGGSTLSKKMMDAMVEANENYVYLWDLIKKGGDMIAKECGAEAAWITPGAFSALVMGAAACMTGKDPEKMRRLPDTTGMKNEIIIQRANRMYVYDRSMEVPGGKFVPVGDESWGCTPELIENAINEKTAAIHHVITGKERYGVVPVEKVVEVAHKHGVPVILDVSGMTYPLDGLTKFVKAGVDIVCYGGKYVGGPNSTGFAIGRKDLIESIALHSFIGAEAGPKEEGGFYRSIGRGYKMDRQEIVALLVAFKEWISMDHDKVRFQPAWERAHYIMNNIKDLPGLSDAVFEYKPKEQKGCTYHTIGIVVSFPDRSLQEVRDLVYSLRVDDPEIWVRYLGVSDNFGINTLMLLPGEEKILVERFKKLFS